MKRRLLMMLALGLAVVFLSGCVSIEEEITEEAEPLVNEEEQIEYTALLEELFNEFYWNYDEESIEFVETTVPDKKTEFGKMAIEASEKAGYKLGRYAGDELMCAVSNLQFYNGNIAGSAFVYINGGKVAGVYYVPSVDVNKAYSLNDRNVFSSNAGFTAFETDAPKMEFNESNFNYLRNGFSSEGDNGRNFMTSVVDENYVDIYTVNSTTAWSKRLSFEEIVIDCAVSAKDDAFNGIAVILGRRGYAGEHSENHSTISEKIALFDKNGTPVGEITSEEKGYSFVGFDGEYIVVCQNGFIDFYKGTTKEMGIYAGIEITDMKKCDFDGDGRYEYALTDGLDLYVCRMENHTLTILWRTNISSKFFDGNIYIGDLNGDGVSEIYLADLNGYGIKYTLTEKGFKYDIVGEGGELYYVGDFNLDGKSDYIEAFVEESIPAKINYAK